MTRRGHSHLQTFAVATPFKLSALWASLMFCYVYGDYFGLYVPGKLTEVAAGRMAFGELSQASLAVVAVMMAVPALMVALSVVLRPTLSRALNIVFGIAYAAIILLTMSGGAPPYYIILGIIEVVLSAAITAYALAWPRSDTQASPLAL